MSSPAGLPPRRPWGGTVKRLLGLSPRPEPAGVLRRAFGRDRVVLPVVHVESPGQALDNAAIAREAGADGLFLINHGMGDADLLAVHESVADAHPGWWVGVNCLYFGGVAFKYQRTVSDLEAACRIAARFMDVVTTSGPATGRAADAEKIRRMKAALGPTPLAIASGISPENVGDFLPHADAFLVATGISRSFSELDPTRVKALVVRVRESA